MQFLTTAEAAKKWGVSSSLVLKLAQNGRIPGTAQIGSRWMIPESAEKPTDKRTRAGKSEESDNFRFPGFEYRSLSSFNPPLNEEELKIKAATEAVYACRFKEAEKILGDLADTTNNRYLRINALYTRCMTDIYTCNASHFIEYYGRLTTELEEDFPHKAEMMEYIYSIDATLGEDAYYGRGFQLQSGYEYHESFIPRLANLSAVSLTFAVEKPTASELRAHELSCIFLKNSEAYADLVQLHLYIGIAYGELGNTEKQIFHLRKALALAEKYEVYYCVAYHYYLMRKLFKPVITEFSGDFKARIEKCVSYMKKQFTRFMDALSMNSIYKLMHHGDYIFLQYAVQGLSNKEIADRLHISVGTVGKRYSDIYAGLGVKDKHDLVALYRKTTRLEDYYGERNKH